MISREQYFGTKSHTEVQVWAFDDLNQRVQALNEEYYAATGAQPDIDPDTLTEISGKKNGSGDGGFRVRGSATSAGRLSSHEDALAVDRSDQDNAFDAWLDQFEDGLGGNSKLAEHGLYREHPSATPTWCHLTTRPPNSGKRTFYP